MCVKCTVGERVKNIGDIGGCQYYNMWLDLWKSNILNNFDNFLLYTHLSFTVLNIGNINGWLQSSAE